MESENYLLVLLVSCFFLETAVVAHPVVHLRRMKPLLNKKHAISSFYIVQRCKIFKQLKTLSMLLLPDGFSCAEIGCSANPVIWVTSFDITGI